MKRKSSIIGISIVTFLVFLYVGVGVYYQTRFLPNTQVGLVDISGDSVEEANRKLAKNLHAQTVGIIEGNETLAALTPSDVEASIEAEALLVSAKQEQGSWGWPWRLFPDKLIETNGAGVAYDETKMAAFLTTLPIADQGRTPTQNATLVHEDGQFIIRPEVLGTRVDRDQLTQAILEAMVGAGTVAVEDSYQKPTLMKEDANLQAAAAKLGELAETRVTYEFSGVKETVPRELST